MAKTIFRGSTRSHNNNTDDLDKEKTLVYVQHKQPASHSRKPISKYKVGLYLYLPTGDPESQDPTVYTHDP